MLSRSLLLVCRKNFLVVLCLVLLLCTLSLRLFNLLLIMFTLRKIFQKDEERKVFDEQKLKVFVFEIIIEIKQRVVNYATLTSSVGLSFILLTCFFGNL